MDALSLLLLLLLLFRMIVDKREKSHAPEVHFIPRGDPNGVFVEFASPPSRTNPIRIAVCVCMCTRFATDTRDTYTQ